MQIFRLALLHFSLLQCQWLSTAFWQGFPSGSSPGTQAALLPCSPQAPHSQGQHRELPQSPGGIFMRPQMNEVQKDTQSQAVLWFEFPSVKHWFCREEGGCPLLTFAKEKWGIVWIPTRGPWLHPSPCKLTWQERILSRSEENQRDVSQRSKHHMLVSQHLTVVKWTEQKGWQIREIGQWKSRHILLCFPEEFHRHEQCIPPKSRGSSKPIGVFHTDYLR